MKKYLSYKVICLVLCLVFFSCSKKIKRLQGKSKEQCLANAMQFQQPFSSLHGDIKLSIKNEADKIHILSHFQVDPKGRMMLSVDKFGFVYAIALVEGEDMQLWQSGEKGIWQGTVADGLYQLFGVHLSMKDLMQMIFVYTPVDQVQFIESNGKTSSQTFSYIYQNIEHRISKKKCKLISSHKKNVDEVLSIKTEKYIDLPSKKRLAKKNSINQGERQIQLSFNQVFEKKLNEKKWQDLQRRFKKMSKP